MNLEIKLPVEFKAKWIAALRSGEFKQNMYYLKTSKGHCCLGVAVEVFNKIGFQSFSDAKINDFLIFPTLAGSTGLLNEHDVPEAVFGALNQRAVFMYGNEKTSVQDRLSVFNDGGFDFSFIANWIDENL